MSDVPLRNAALAVAATVVLVVLAVRQAQEDEWGHSAALAVGAVAVALGAILGFIWFYGRRGRRERGPWPSDRG